MDLYLAATDTAELRGDFADASATAAIRSAIARASSPGRSDKRSIADKAPINPDSAARLLCSFK